MDYTFEVYGMAFVADEEKARANLVNHGVSFERAAEVFFDPFVRIEDASRNDEERSVPIGYQVSTRLLYVVHIEIEYEAIPLISAAGRRRQSENAMIPERIEKR